MSLEVSLQPRFIRLKQVKRETGLSRSALYALIKEGKFPAQIRLCTRSVGWIEGEVHMWIKQRIHECRGGCI